VTEEVEPYFAFAFEIARLDKIVAYAARGVDEGNPCRFFYEADWNKVRFRLDADGAGFRLRVDVKQKPVGAKCPVDFLQGVPDALNRDSS